MKSGEYRQAATSLTRAAASAPDGFPSKLGGFYTVWLVQALHASGKEAEAITLLERCVAHPDDEVVRIAIDVRSILTAPKLTLDEGSFIKIQPLAPDGAWGRPIGADADERMDVLLGARRRRPAASVEEDEDILAGRGGKGAEGAEEGGGLRGKSYWWAIAAIVLFQVVEAAAWLGGAGQ